MPELPEVENTKRYLIESGIKNLTIESVWTDSPTKWIGTDPHKFHSDFLGSRIVDVERVAKYLIIHTSVDDFILHLGMTGWIRLQHADAEAHKFTRHVIHFSNSDELRFMDSRKFGKIICQQKLTQSLLPDPLSDQFALNKLPASVLGRKRSIKSILMDQSVIPGLGNLYTDESLFQATINPFTPIKDLTTAQLELLTIKIKSVLQRSLDEYDLDRGINDAEPYFSMTPWDINRSVDGPCFKCGAPMQFARINSRGTYFCPQCQSM
tara:strand:+ start:8394 stop:9191 length:798 start_codon:yes stop_codon:yes gene_type:complete